MSNLIGEIFGWIGTILSIIFYFAPIYQFNELIKGKIDYKKIPFVLLTMSLLTIIFWVIYGINTKSYQIIITNLIGGIATLIFILIYLVYFSNKNMKKSSIYICSFIIINIILIFIVFKFFNNDIIGFCAMIFNIMMFASPCLKIIQVYQTKDYKFLPISSSIAACASSTCWTIYGIGINDFKIIVPNALGFIFSIIQIFVFVIYYNMAKNQKNNIIQDLMENTDSGKEILQI